MRGILLSALLFVGLVACGDTDRPLRDMRSSGAGPDEFAVIPLNPLTVPPTSSLPVPTPGGTNLTDRTPNEDAIAALGGSAASLVAGGIPAQDAALVAQSGRYGIDPNIRAQLASEDEQILERARLTNVFNPLGRDRYFPAYANQALDASTEAERLRALGVDVPIEPVGQAVPAEDDIECTLTTAGDPDNRLRRLCLPVETSQ